MSPEVHDGGEDDVADGPSVPLGAVPPEAVKQLSDFGPSRGAARLLLYRALANHEEVLRGWIELAWRLRLKSTTPRRVRELMIYRTAMISNCEYELRGHRDLALANGVSRQELDGLADWRSSPSFSTEERAALAFSEAMYAGHVPDDVLAEMGRHFDAARRIELIVTCGFYNMVPRVVNALRLPLEERHR